MTPRITDSESRANLGVAPRRDAIEVQLVSARPLGALGEIDRDAGGRALDLIRECFVDSFQSSHHGPE